MSYQAIVVKANKELQQVTISTYEDLSRHLEGHIEAVDLRFRNGAEATLWVNEEFRLGHYGPEDRNSIATDLAGMGGRVDLLMSPILGPAVLTGGPDREGETTDAPDPAVAVLVKVAQEAGGIWLPVEVPA